MKNDRYANVGGFYNVYINKDLRRAAKYNCVYYGVRFDG